MKSALKLITEALNDHKVKISLSVGKSRKTYYLVEINVELSLFRDFLNTYDEQVTSLHKKIAKKLFSSKPTNNVYGLVIDENHNLVYAFNRLFADIDHEKGIIQYIDIDDLLAEKVEPVKVPFSPPPSKPWPNSNSGAGGMTMRYSLTEKE